MEALLGFHVGFWDYVTFVAIAVIVGGCSADSPAHGSTNEHLAPGHTGHDPTPARFALRKIGSCGPVNAARCYVLL
jgi:hypothetical protein